eukprot:3697332-Pleurochrysis_carterae.AAC.1
MRNSHTIRHTPSHSLVLPTNSSNPRPSPSNPPTPHTPSQPHRACRDRPPPRQSVAHRARLLPSGGGVEGQPL